MPNRIAPVAPRSPERQRFTFADQPHGRPPVKLLLDEAIDELGFVLYPASWGRTGDLRTELTAKDVATAAASDRALNTDQTVCFTSNILHVDKPERIATATSRIQRAVWRNRFNCYFENGAGYLEKVGPMPFFTQAMILFKTGKVMLPSGESWIWVHRRQFMKWTMKQKPTFDLDAKNGEHLASIFEKAAVDSGISVHAKQIHFALEKCLYPYKFTESSIRDHILPLFENSQLLSRGGRPKNDSDEILLAAVEGPIRNRFWSPAKSK